MSQYGRFLFSAKLHFVAKNRTQRSSKTLRSWLQRQSWRFILSIHSRRSDLQLNLRNISQYRESKHQQSKRLSFPSLNDRHFYVNKNTEPKRHKPRKRYLLITIRIQAQQLFTDSKHYEAMKLDDINKAALVSWNLLVRPQTSFFGFLLVYIRITRITLHSSFLRIAHWTIINDVSERAKA